MEASEQSGALRDREVGKRAPDRAPSLSEGWGSWGGWADCSTAVGVPARLLLWYGVQRS